MEMHRDIAASAAAGSRAHLSAKDTAKFLGCSRRHLQRMRSRGEGPPFFVYSRTLCYNIEDLIVWTKTRRRTRAHA
ncbi:helix-turn-helix domain-containing protein [Novosphingobium sp. PS1R-30]|uniref:Helix-turn-helix domain-containing protein n=1 Tax=Novosphingobium anseongense TaxID=3133436 RepID=A0ABU8S2N4_9SPHN